MTLIAPVLPDLTATVEIGTVDVGKSRIMIRIGGGFPSIEKTAATFGISKSRMRWLTALLDEVQQGRANTPGRGRKAKVAGLSGRSIIACDMLGRAKRARGGRNPVAAPKSKAASSPKASRRKKNARRRRRVL
jgi:hypothetical protein